MHWLTVVASVGVVATYIRAIFFTPPEILQGYVQKIYYLHVPAAVVAFLAFGVVAVASIAYLWLKDERLDHVAESSAEVGVIFTTVVLFTGPLWGKPIWGVWWVWEDVRLTLTLFLWFVYLAYILLRSAVEAPALRARYSAVLGILGALLIPFIHLSVYLFRGQHPMPVVLKPGRPDLPPEMLTTLLLGFASFTVLYLAFLRVRYALARTRSTPAA